MAKSLRNNPLAKNYWRLRWYPVCASTEVSLSNWLNEEQSAFKEQQRIAIFAARQNHGRGQLGRAWQSPFGGVWLSAAMPWPDLDNSSGLLGFAVAVALCERLERKGINVKIKWPNDLMVGNKKLAGFLPRLISRGTKIRFARIGLGLNVCNQVPKEGISLGELIKTTYCHIDYWASESLIALDHAIELASTPGWVCSETHRRLWAKFVVDPKSGKCWDIEGLNFDGSLRIQRNGKEVNWSRWN